MLYQFKSILLLAFLNGLLLAVGRLVGGSSGMLIALGLALLMNFGMYYYSEEVALRVFNAQRMQQDAYPHIYEALEELSARANIPMPKLWVIKEDMPNAFATGRDQEHCSVAFTTGILTLLNKDELRAVAAHEMAHILNRDILITSIAAMAATALSILADVYRWSSWFGSRRDDDRDHSAGTYILVVLLTPLVATLLQLALSRTREYFADEYGARLSQSPHDLAAALEKIHGAVERGHCFDKEATTAQKPFAALFFSSPFKGAGGWFLSWFSTHPPVKDRVQRLSNMKFFKD